MTKLDSILKSWDITLPTKFHLVKTMVFPEVMYEYESWTVKKAESLRINAFALWCWRRLMKVPWTARRSNQSILREINPDIHWKDWCWSWNFNTLAIWCEDLTHWKRPCCWEMLKAGEGDNRGWDGWMALLTPWAWVWVNSGSWWWTGRLMSCSPWNCKELDAAEGLNWTELYHIVQDLGGSYSFSSLKWGVVLNSDYHIFDSSSKIKVEKYFKNRNMEKIVLLFLFLGYSW